MNWRSNSPNTSPSFIPTRARHVDQSIGTDPTRINTYRGSIRIVLDGARAIQIQIPGAIHRAETSLIQQPHDALTVVQDLSWRKRHSYPPGGAKCRIGIIIRASPTRVNAGVNAVLTKSNQSLRGGVFYRRSNPTSNVGDCFTARKSAVRLAMT